MTHWEDQQVESENLEHDREETSCCLRDGISLCTFGGGMPLSMSMLTGLNCRRNFMFLKMTLCFP